MRTLFVLLMLVSLVNIPARSQPDVPALPDADYAVLTAAVNYLSFCVHPGMAHRRGELLFLHDITQTQKKYGFDFNFARDQRNLSFLLNPAGTFDTEPEWVTFLSSIDSARFTPHRHGYLRLPVVKVRCGRNSSTTFISDQRPAKATGD